MSKYGFIGANVVSDFDVVATTNTSGTVELDLDNNSIFTTSITGNITTLTLTNTTGRAGSFVWIIEHNATTAYSIAFPSGCYHFNADDSVAKTYSTADLPLGATKRSAFSIFSDGTNYYVTQTKFWAL